MATAYTDTVINYSGNLYTKSNNATPLIDAIFTRGKRSGLGIARTGVRKVNGIQFPVSSGYSIGDGAQPAITEAGSATAPTATSTTRDQQSNCIQIFQYAVDVTYLKQSAYGTMGGLNIAGQVNNVPNELDFQVNSAMMKAKKDLNYTYINGAYQASSGNTVAWKSKGLISALSTNAATYAHSGSISAAVINSAINSSFANGFQFNDGDMELWVNPSNLETLNTAYVGLTGFGLPDSRNVGGVAIRQIMTSFGMLNVNYDSQIPAGTYLLLNMRELAVAELDTVNDGINKGSWFYEPLSKTGASEKGQIYAMAGVDYGAEYHHIKITEAAEAAT